MTKELGIDGKGRSLTRGRRALNFLQAMIEVLKLPKVPEKRHVHDPFTRLQAEHLRSKKKLKARIKELEEENQVLRINLMVAMRDRC